MSSMLGRDEALPFAEKVTLVTIAGSAERTSDDSMTPPTSTLPLPSATQRQSSLLRTLLRMLKGVFITAELTAALLLALYAGLVAVLPATPPAARMDAASAAVTTRPAFYCWLTPGRGTCTGDLGSPSPKLPSLTSTVGASIAVNIATPAPSSCLAAATDPSDAAAPAIPLRTVAEQTPASSSTAASYRLAVSLAPGRYLLTVTCAWSGRPVLRWLDGQGAATYVLSLYVTK